MSPHTPAPRRRRRPNLATPTPGVYKDIPHDQPRHHWFRSYSKIDPYDSEGGQSGLRCANCLRTLADREMACRVTAI